MARPANERFFVDGGAPDRRTEREGPADGPFRQFVLLKRFQTAL
jgi:hypothetical protein